MVDRFGGRTSRRLAAAACGVVLTAALAGCGGSDPKSTPPPPPPPSLAVVIPPQPRPPLASSPGMVIPPVDAAGVRQTINVGVTQSQLLWNFRSAYNVAALDCQRPGDAAILENYKLFLKANDKRLQAANKDVDKVFGGTANKANIRAREAYMTHVYNFYALPPTLPQFCDAALAMSNDGRTVTMKNLDAFAAANLPKLDKVFLDFFTAYDQYRNDTVAWQTRYTPGQPAPLVSIAAPAVTPVAGPSGQP